MDQGHVAMNASAAVKEIPPLRRSRPIAARKPLVGALLGLAMLASAAPLLAQTANTTTKYTYDALDRPTQVTDPSGLNTTYQYDGLSNPTGLTSPDTGVTARTYDAAGNVLTATDAKGVLVTYTYDAQDRRLSASYADNTQNIAYHYDEANSVTGCSSSYPIGHLSRIVETAVTTVYCYDAQGRVIEKQQITGATTDTTGYAYTAAGRLSGMVYPSGTLTTYTRDSDGRIQGLSVTPPNGTASTAVSSVTYQPFGPVSGYTLGNGQAVTRAYDANYRLTDLTSPAFNLHFARDAMGDITALGNAPGANPATETYNYDPLYRLTGITDTGAALETYTYNPTGDRLSKTAPGLATGTYLYTTGTHQIASIGNAAQANDADGNTTGSVIGGNTYGFGYNERNRLTVVQLNGQTVGNYTYSALGERIGKVASFPQAVTERYAYNEAGQLIGEYGTTNRDYIWLGGLPVAVVDNTINGSVTTSTVNYVTADQLGTPRVVANSAGTVIWQLPYVGNPFGEHQPTSTTGYVLNLRFPGQYYDAESGLVHNGFRDYCPACGRYIQSDPVGLAAGMSTYAYTGSSPLNASDRLGLSCSAAGGTVTCAAPGGPTVSFPQPAGWPTTINSSSENYHAYDVPVSTGGADAGAITQQIINNPTPGSPSAATAGGTYNDATPTAFQDLSNFLDGIGDGAGGGYNNSPVMSYVTVDPATGNTVVVNVTLPGHPLFPGYVAREVCGGVVHNFGEGTSSLQSPSSPFANDINNVWIQQTQNLINNVSK
ncbi:RHS repeat-associated core domain-containing protein [Dyella agri]|uniref:RHS repeat protein n=1 Tax=Dyella agri TaxID=1926869 RepID=A0ABW8KIB9_9GAMM